MIGWETLALYGIPHAGVAATPTLKSALRTRSAFAAAGVRSVCLKVETDEHKSQKGLLALDIRSSRELSAAWAALTRRAHRTVPGTQIYIQEQVPAGLEFIVGAIRDETFGVAVMVGIGGRLAESIDRQATRVAPVHRRAAAAAVAELGEAVPSGARASLAEILCSVARLMQECPGIKELDLNPVIVTADNRAIAVDLRSRGDPGVPEVPPPLPLPAASRGDAIQAVRLLSAPQSVVVVGVGQDASKPGRAIFDRLMAEDGSRPVYAISRTSSSRNDSRWLGSSDELPAGIDVAVIATPAGAVAAALRACGSRGIRAAVVLAGGFAESGNLAAEEEVARAAAEAGVRVCGVNTIGLVGELPLTFSAALRFPLRRGSVSLVTQSGAVGGSLLLQAIAMGTGIRRFFCVGNQTDLVLPDYLSALASDEGTSTVGLFIEGVSDGAYLRSALRSLQEAGKHTVVLKAGASDIGSESVRSHTGAMAGSARIYEAVFRETGCVVTHDLPELITCCHALSSQPLAGGRRVAIVSTSGGACSLIADLARARGLEVPKMEQAIRGELNQRLPAFAATRNPIDTTAQVLQDPNLLYEAALLAAQSHQVDSLLLGLTTIVEPQAGEIADSIVRLSGATSKPILVAWTVPETLIPTAYAQLRPAGIPIFPSFTMLVSAAAALSHLTKDANGAQSP